MELRQEFICDQLSDIPLFDTVLSQILLGQNFLVEFDAEFHIGAAFKKIIELLVHAGHVIEDSQDQKFFFGVYFQDGGDDDL